jgi:hypothetical protein
MPLILAGWEAEIVKIRRAACANSSSDSAFKITRTNWTGGGSSGREPALQVQSSEFKPRSQQKRKKSFF